MNNDRVEVDELILEIAGYKNDFADMAAEKLFRMCSTSWEAYQYLQDRVHDAWLLEIKYVSNCAESSKGYKCTYISLANTGGRMSIHNRIKSRLTLAA